MAHEPYCNCCGCSQLPIALSIDQLNTDGPLVDYPSSYPSEVTVVDATWSNLGINGPVLGGSSQIDFRAAQITAGQGYLALLRRASGSSWVYPSGSPPSGGELSAVITVSLYDTIEATQTFSLTSRSVPAKCNLPNLYQVDQQQSPGPAIYGTGAYATTNSDRGGFTFNAFYYMPEPAYEDAYGTLPAVPGFPLSDFEDRDLPDIESVVLQAENCSMLGAKGWSVYQAPTNPPSLTGFDLSVSLAFGDEDRIVVLRQAVGLSATQPAIGAATSLGCVAQGSEDELPTEGFFTAWVGRGSRSEAATQSPTHRTVTIYRDGDQVLSANNPTAGQINAAQEEDGVYLIVTEVDERSLSEWENPYPDDRAHPARMLKDYSGLVVDSVKPVVGFTVPNDVYGQASPQGRIVATEPLITLTDQMADEDPTSVMTRPTGLKLFSPTSGSNDGPGTYTLKLFNRTDHFDIGGNYPDVAPTVQWTAHVMPTGAWGPTDNEYGHWGGIPTLEDPGLQTREYWRPRLDTEPVASLALTFNRKVNASQVVASQLTLTKDGTAVAGFTLEPVDDGGRKWKVTISTADQTPRSFWVLTYNPAGQVVTDDIAILRFENRSDFPAAGQFKTVYIHKDDEGNDVRFYYGRPSGVGTGPITYVAIGEDDPPVDQLGTPYEPEPCVLATRVAWLMADMDGYPRAIDTGSTTGAHQIGRVVSVSSLVGFDAEEVNSTIGASGGAYFQYQAPLGTFSPLLSHKGYTPNVPTLTSPPADCSYFGLTTTIDPCPPADSPLCLSPKIAQKHASAIRCDGDIESFEVTLVAFDDSGDPVDLSGVKFGNVVSGLGPDVPVDFYVNSPGIVGPAFSQLQNAQGSRAAAFLMAKSGAAYTFGKTLAGDTLSQNVWACVDGSRAAEMPVQEAVTRQPDGICEDWDESLYSVGIKFGPITYSQEDVVDWDLNPNFNLGGDNKVVLRDGEDTVVEKYMPGDLYPSNSPPSQSGRCIAWWSDRLNPITREDCEFQRAYQSGIVRKLTAGSLSQTGLQGALSAYRAHKTFPALKTTTLGELCLSISLRMTITAEIEYEDRQLSGKYYTRASGYGEAAFDKCGNHTFDETARTIGPSWTPAAGSFENGYPPCNVETFTLSGGVIEWSSWDEGEEVDTKTVTHHFLADLNNTFALSKEKEEALANGEDVYVIVDWTATQGAPAGGYWYWKLKKV